jgi:hypothetical protein
VQQLKVLGMIPQFAKVRAEAFVKTERMKRIIGKGIYADEDATHIRFLHPTKGYRRISKRRLGL